MIGQERMKIFKTPAKLMTGHVDDIAAQIVIHFGVESTAYFKKTEGDLYNGIRSSSKLSGSAVGRFFIYPIKSVVSSTKKSSHLLFPPSNFLGRR